MNIHVPQIVALKASHMVDFMTPQSLLSWKKCLIYLTSLFLYISDNKIELFKTHLRPLCVVSVKWSWHVTAEWSDYSMVCISTLSTFDTKDLEIKT